MSRACNFSFKEDGSPLNSKKPKNEPNKSGNKSGTNHIEDAVNDTGLMEICMLDILDDCNPPLTHISSDPWWYQQHRSDPWSKSLNLEMKSLPILSSPTLPSTPTYTTTPQISQEELRLLDLWLSLPARFERVEDGLPGCPNPEVMDWIPDTTMTSTTPERLATTISFDSHDHSLPPMLDPPMSFDINCEGGHGDGPWVIGTAPQSLPCCQHQHDSSTDDVHMPRSGVHFHSCHSSRRSRLSMGTAEELKSTTPQTESRTSGYRIKGTHRPRFAYY